MAWCITARSRAWQVQCIVHYMVHYIVHYIVCYTVHGMVHYSELARLRVLLHRGALQLLVHLLLHLGDPVVLVLVGVST